MKLFASLHCLQPLSIEHVAHPLSIWMQMTGIREMNPQLPIILVLLTMNLAQQVRHPCAFEILLKSRSDQ